MTAVLPAGAVLIVGTGLIGTSVGLALRSHGVPVHLTDADPERLREAVRRGGGTDAKPVEVGLVVVAVPPRLLGKEVVAALGRWSRAVVTDVGSVKALPTAEVLATGADSGRYAGGHPLAGSERSGPGVASPTLFAGRPWAVTPHERTTAPATEAVRALAELCGAFVVELSPDEHDTAVAAVSHLPHLLAVLAAAQLTRARGDQLLLAGQGVRDVTRVAASDPVLWRQILTANAGPLRELLLAVRRDLDYVIDELGDGDAALQALLERGRSGTELIPPTYASAPAEQTSRPADVPDQSR